MYFSGMYDCNNFLQMYTLKFSMADMVKVKIGVHESAYISLLCTAQKVGDSCLHKQVPVAEDLECHTAHNHSLPVPALSSARRLGWALWTYTSPHCLETSPLTCRKEEFVISLNIVSVLYLKSP